MAPVRKAACAIPISTVPAGTMALAQSLGLTCDPVTGLVPVPCILATLRLWGRRRLGLRSGRSIRCHPLRIGQVPPSAQRLVELNNDKPPADLRLVKRLLGQKEPLLGFEN